MSNYEKGYQFGQTPLGMFIGLLFIAVLIVAIVLIIRTIQKSPFTKTFNHVSGLSVPVNSKCSVKCTKYQISIMSNGQIFELNANKIKDISVTTTTEIQKQAVSSIGRAAIGGAILGFPGLVIGGLVQNRTYKINTYILIITYISNHETKYIVFDCGTSKSDANRIIKYYPSIQNRVITTTQL